ncbi:uncharacterized protein L969DRAFT_52307 [Mixia osmundae IAM 14324]|uniref:NYN domain-containing protein n=1 Tax=Mixia osmundae (strain CBS 9802 / IAM 14324 / JCM 22182 / KY 12970) TaxID=764103 RepID=G7E4R4_MIXOS|nr:uncharacterized protein L969DRAFT_52307 [Mixia osmundae IAM 14324]KEI37645.1 hypothetical protein L969DRAFT_52307 [Mixia osmundae IAM 14324]GAA97824.1 hypothetical protein E5Q_04503 [Mixia osmundae IAM 14324]
MGKSSGLPIRLVHAHDELKDLLCKTCAHTGYRPGHAPELMLERLSRCGEMGRYHLSKACLPSDRIVQELEQFDGTLPGQDELSTRQLVIYKLYLGLLSGPSHSFEYALDDSQRQYACETCHKPLDFGKSLVGVASSTGQQRYFCRIECTPAELQRPRGTSDAATPALQPVLRAPAVTRSKPPLSEARRAIAEPALLDLLMPAISLARVHLEQISQTKLEWLREAGDARLLLDRDLSGLIAKAASSSSDSLSAPEELSSDSDDFSSDPDDVPAVSPRHLRTRSRFDPSTSTSEGEGATDQDTPKLSRLSKKQRQALAKAARIQQATELTPGQTKSVPTTSSSRSVRFESTSLLEPSLLGKSLTRSGAATVLTEVEKARSVSRKLSTLFPDEDMSELYGASSGDALLSASPGSLARDYTWADAKRSSGMHGFFAADPAPAELFSTTLAPRRSAVKGGPVFIFVDHSNILYSWLEWLKNTKTYPHPWPKMKRPRIDYTTLFAILERGRNIAKRMLVASSPLHQSLEPVVQAQYDVAVLQRVPQQISSSMVNQLWSSSHSKVPGVHRGTGGFVTDSGEDSDYYGERSSVRKTQKEQAVDEVLNLSILETLLDFEVATDEMPTIVLASGDGASSEFTSGGFHKTAERALQRGYNVEIVSFSAGMSSSWKRSAKLHDARSSARLTIVTLDQFGRELLQD